MDSTHVVTLLPDLLLIEGPLCCDDEDQGCVAAGGRADGGSSKSDAGSAQILMGAADRNLPKGSGCCLRVSTLLISGGDGRTTCCCYPSSSLGYLGWVMLTMGGCCPRSVGVDDGDVAEQFIVVAGQGLRWIVDGYCSVCVGRCGCSTDRLMLMLLSFMAVADEDGEMVTKPDAMVMNGGCHHW
ncbi:hypothetical protein ACLOJK_036410 [Asimina triloba]